MKRIAILAAVLALVACHKPAETPATTSSAAPPPATPAPATAAPIAKYVPPPDVSVTNAPVPTSGLELWLRADSGVTAGADGKVSSWAVDGSSVKATADGDKQPTLVQNAIGGKPAIHFDGGNNILEANINIDPAASPELTVISVFSSDTDAVTPLRKLYGADDGGYDRAAGLDNRAEGYNYTIFGGSSDVIGIFKLATNTPYLTVDSYDQPKKVLNVWVNGAPAKQNQKIDHGASLTKFYIGGTGTVYHEAWQGNVAEMLVYHRILNDEERKKIEDYLAAKYGLKLTR